MGPPPTFCALKGQVHPHLETFIRQEWLTIHFQVLTESCNRPKGPSSKSWKGCALACIWVCPQVPPWWLHTVQDNPDPKPGADGKRPPPCDVATLQWWRLPMSPYVPTTPSWRRLQKINYGSSSGPLTPPHDETDMGPMIIVVLLCLFCFPMRKTSNPHKPGLWVWEIKKTKAGDLITSLSIEKPNLRSR